MRCVWLAVYLTRARAVNEYAYSMAALHSSAAHAAMPIYQTLLPFLPFPNFRRGLCGGSGNETNYRLLYRPAADSLVVSSKMNLNFKGKINEYMYMYKQAIQCYKFVATSLRYAVSIYIYS